MSKKLNFDLDLDADLGEMKRSDNLTMWVALKLKTKNQKATFDFVYDHADCVLGDIIKGTGIKKHSLMTVLRSLREKDIVLYEEEEGQHRRHYYVNKDLVNQMLQVFRERVERYMSRFSDSWKDEDNYLTN